jgi:hypothetical protein
VATLGGAVAEEWMGEVLPAVVKKWRPAVNQRRQRGGTRRERWWLGVSWLESGGGAPSACSVRMKVEEEEASVGGNTPGE